jgi:cellulose synthase/poly-beta-1,6-N-acetylglucosamine synthase-like glycosyltransferase
LINSLNNYFYLRPNKAKIVDSKIAILIPARDEEENIKKLLSDLSEQILLSDYSVTVLDDNSTDLTADAVRSFINRDEKFELLDGKTLPSDWLGKNYACHQLAISKSDANYLVFLDADVRVSNDAIATALAELQVKKLDFISPYPRQIAKSWSEHLIQPLLQWSWLSTLSIKFAQKSSRPSLTAANGQFFVVKTAAYIASGGHKSIKGEVIDDMELAKSLKRSGFKGGVTNGSKIASCRMYQNWSQLRNGYQKSLWRAFKEIPNAIILSLLLIVFFIFSVKI